MLILRLKFPFLDQDFENLILDHNISIRKNKILNVDLLLSPGLYIWIRSVLFDPSKLLNIQPYLRSAAI